jgi:Uncharacterized conserved protein
MDLGRFYWINEPKISHLAPDSISFQTEPGTDFWQRTYYGFQNDNAPACLMPVEKQKFSFSVNVRYTPAQLFDQAGVIIYQDSENWCKASVEFEDERVSKLGSVVTNQGYSDWATTDIECGAEIRMSYRLSRRNKDFLIESALNGSPFHQMRIFHLHAAADAVNIGIYACSPLQSSFRAVFSSFELGECVWEAYQLPGG